MTYELPMNNGKSLTWGLTATSLSENFWEKIEKKNNPHMVVKTVKFFTTN